MVGRGLSQLIAYGASDVYLTGTYNITYPLNAYCIYKCKWRCMRSSVRTRTLA